MSFFDDEPDVVPLITFRRGSYQVEQSTVEWLQGIREPLGVLSCVGKYRTGKSYLMSELVQCEPHKGFAVGNSVQACTKGIWVYSKLLKLEQCSVLVIDTEGIDSLDADDRHDVCIFTMTLLLSSSFLFNSMGPIDEASLQTLSLMLRVTDHVRVSHDAPASLSDLAGHFPRFYWVLRDFSLDLKNREGESISEQQYFEDALCTDDSARLGIRNAIREAFKQRTLVTIPRPAADDVTQLVHKPNSRGAKFKRAVDALRDRLFLDMRPMRAGGAPMTGNMFAELCRYVVDVVDGNNVPVIGDAWTLMAAVQNRDLKDGLLLEMKTLVSALKPKSTRLLEKEVEAIKALLMSRFREVGMAPLHPDVLASFQSAMDENGASAIAQLSQRSDALIDELHKDLHARVREYPLHLHELLTKQQEAFMVRCDNDPDLSDKWHAMTGKFVMDTLIDLVLDHLRDAHAHAHKLQQEAHNALTAELERVKCEHDIQVDSVRNELAETRQTVQNLEITVDREQRETERMMTELVPLQVRADALDTENAELRKVLEAREDETTAKRNVEEVNILQAFVDDLQLKLDQCKRENQQLEERMHTAETSAKSTQSRLQTVSDEFENGMQSLKARFEEEAAGVAVQHEREMDALRKVLESLQSKHDSVHQELRALKTTLREANDECASKQSEHQREIARMTQEISRYKSELREAQERILKMHEAFLEDTRNRDEKNREQRMRETKEHLECRTKYDLVCKQHAEETTLNKELKRRLDCAEKSSMDVKRVKSSLQESELSCARVEAESKQLAASVDQLRLERDELIRQNSKLEAEVAVLRNIPRAPPKPH